MPETLKSLPLSGTEVQQAILFKIAESFDKSCHLAETNAYTSFKAEISVKLTLNDFGREQKDNHFATVAEVDPMEPDSLNAGHEELVNLEIEAQPPNQVRVETEQPVPVQTTEEGKQVIKRVKYQPRKAKSKSKPE